MDLNLWGKKRGLICFIESQISDHIFTFVSCVTRLDLIWVNLLRGRFRNWIPFLVQPVTDLKLIRSIENILNISEP